ncbi:uncharacterized protein HD556DRAFT_1448242 [Suillus plorans]|uniref:Uncharacterized protein n=1 Tax=Suillus plorans TaxID=116603 RepID=A0A9P7AES2_9AGAM|nr:uncharacterized protein HD556DRAFT_1448242 [Suillus plorans]KAG1787908.1 hypothetical protein HD556DRAFT_1448242 [Suillus plorans]
MGLAGGVGSVRYAARYVEAAVLICRLLNVLPQVQATDLLVLICTRLLNALPSSGALEKPVSAPFMVPIGALEKLMSTPFMIHRVPTCSVHGYRRAGEAHECSVHDYSTRYRRAPFMVTGALEKLMSTPFMGWRQDN